MARLTELLPYLEQGLTLKGGIREQETLTPYGRHIHWEKHQGNGELADQRSYSLAEVKEWRSAWDWGVVFIDQEHKVWRNLCAWQSSTPASSARRYSI